MAKPLEEALLAKLTELGLEQYGNALAENGYESLKDLVDMTPDERKEVAEDVGMLKGHARKFTNALVGSADGGPVGSAGGGRKGTRADFASKLVADEKPVEKVKGDLDSLTLAEVADVEFEAAAAPLLGMVDDLENRQIED